jgi:hypothetical protein
VRDAHPTLVDVGLGLHGVWPTDHDVSVHAVLYGHDDQVVAEMELPFPRAELRLYRAPRPVDIWLDEPTTVAIELIEDYYDVDRRESTLMQLAYQNPNVWVYRRRE